MLSFDRYQNYTMSEKYMLTYRCWINETLTRFLDVHIISHLKDLQMFRSNDLDCELLSYVRKSNKKKIVSTFFLPLAKLWRCRSPFCDVLWKLQRKRHALWGPSYCKQIHRRFLPSQRRSVDSKRKDVSSFTSSENFLASGLCENEVNLSPEKMDLRGLCCPLVKRSNSITVISPPWLHLKLFPSEKTSRHQRRAFVLFSLGEYILFHRSKNTKTSKWRHNGRSLSFREAA